MATPAAAANGIVHPLADALGTTTLGTAAVGISICAAAVVTNAISTSSGTSVADGSTTLTTLGNVAATGTPIGTSVEANGRLPDVVACYWFGCPPHRTPNPRTPRIRPGWSRQSPTKRQRFHRATISGDELSFHLATSNPASSPEPSDSPYF